MDEVPHRLNLEQFGSVVIGTANNAHQLTIDGSVLQAAISQPNQPMPFHGHSANIEVLVIAQKLCTRILATVSSSHQGSVDLASKINWGYFQKL